MGTQDKMFIDNLQVILDLVQMLKYNLDSFKGNDIHKTISKQRDMRPDCAALLNSINAFLLRMKDKCEPATFNELNKIMKREKVHDLSLLLIEMAEVENVEDFTKVIVDIKNEQKAMLKDQLFPDSNITGKTDRHNKPILAGQRIRDHNELEVGVFKTDTGFIVTDGLEVFPSSLYMRLNDFIAQSEWVEIVGVEL